MAYMGRAACSRCRENRHYFIDIKNQIACKIVFFNKGDGGLDFVNFLIYNDKGRVWRGSTDSEMEEAI